MPSELWPVLWPTSFDKSTLDPEQIELAESFAASIMRHLTLERVGGKPVTILPGLKHCHSLTSLFAAHFNFGSDHYLCKCDLGCGCGSEPFIELALPVGRVDAVVIAGVTLDPSKYSVVDGKYLVVDPEYSVSGCRDVEVTYLNGYPVDIKGQYAAGVLAVEYAKLVTGSKQCRLPAGTTSISRQGISIEIATGLYPNGITGIMEVDSYVNLWNPSGLKMRPKVYSPDINRQRQTTWRGL